MGGMRSILSILRRTVLVPAFLPVTVMAAAGTWLGVRLAGAALGGNEGFVGEVREGALLFAALLVLSMAEPLEVGREARGGVLTLHLARGRRLGMAGRCLGLALGTLPAVLVAALAGGGLPSDPLALGLELIVASAAGLFLGAWLDRKLLVPALWTLILVAHLRPWLLGSEMSALAWLLPRMGDFQGGWGVAHALLWAGAMVALTEWRVASVASRGS